MEPKLELGLEVHSVPGLRLVLEYSRARTSQDKRILESVL